MSKDLENKISKAVSIPEYFTKNIDHKINLNDNYKICCPFHEEDSPSFSYSPDRQRWRCFGRCKVGGDVISLHQKHLGLQSRDEAVKSLAAILHIKENTLDLSKHDVVIDKQRVQMLTMVNIANSKAKTVDDYIDLDYILSQFKPTAEILEDLESYMLRFSR